MQRMNVLLLCAGLLFSLIAGCDRFKDDTPNANQAPTARFVNFPEDSTQFSYAPQVHWQGYDPDGFVTGFEYFDDASAEGLAAYRAGDAAFQEYVDGLPDAAWLFTEAASGQIYLLTDIGEISEHVFMVRAIDNLDARSQVAVRTFFRTNLPPDTPKLRWSNSTSTDYEEHIAIPDTQMVGDTLTITYTGVRLLWQGSDPDSRSTNIIPLEFSYALVNALGDSIALPVRNDSNHVVGYRAGWSNWGGETQIALYGLETGDYTFYLRVRDDGFTQSNTPGSAQFTVVKPTLAGQLLIVDENRALSGPDPSRGGIHPDTLKQYYVGSDGRSGVIGTAVDIANQLAPFAQRPGLPPIRPFSMDSIVWFDNRAGNVLSYDFISQFASVWVINDDNVQTERNPIQAATYNKVLADYMDIGGSVLLTGRRAFNKSNGLAAGNSAVNLYLRDYFNVFAVRPKAVFSANAVSSGVDDFGGAVAGDPQYPDLNLNEDMIGRLRYLTDSVTCAPEIEYFGRSNAGQSFDFSTTIYNYRSCTSDTNLYPSVVENYDCLVDCTLTTPTEVALVPQDETLPLLTAISIYNVTRDAYADIREVRNISVNLLVPKWRIFASTSSEDGQWTTADSLAVTYRFIPLSADHDEPIALNFIKYDGTVEIEFRDGQFFSRIRATPRFRSALFAFPLAYMSNELYTHPLLGPVPAVSLVIANEILFFNQNLDIEFN